MSADSSTVVVNVKEIYGEVAKFAQLETYVAAAVTQAGIGNEVVLTGGGPIWLYLRIAHALHGKARRLIYRSGTDDDVVIFDHDPF